MIPPVYQCLPAVRVLNNSLFNAVTRVLLSCADALYHRHRRSAASNMYQVEVFPGTGIITMGMNEPGGPYGTGSWPKMLFCGYTLWCPMSYYIHIRSYVRLKKVRDMLSSVFGNSVTKLEYLVPLTLTYVNGNYSNDENRVTLE